MILGCLLRIAEGVVAGFKAAAVSTIASAVPTVSYPFECLF